MRTVTLYDGTPLPVMGWLPVKTALAGIAAQHGATPYQIALTWLVNQPWVITIPMSHSLEHLQQNWDAAAITLTPEQMAQLDGLVLGTMTMHAKKRYKAEPDHFSACIDSAWDRTIIATIRLLCSLSSLVSKQSHAYRNGTR